jgi:Flp pilus assembly pilin Flp
LKELSGSHETIVVEVLHFRDTYLNTRGYPMPNLICKLSLQITAKLLDETGQDLVEYGLTMAVVALGSIAGMSSVAQSMNQAFLAVGNLLTSSIS